MKIISIILLIIGIVCLLTAGNQPSQTRKEIEELKKIIKETKI